MPEQSIELVVKMICDLKTDVGRLETDNKFDHQQIITHQEKTNGRISALERRLLITWGVLTGITATLIALGLVPDNILQAIKQVI